ncbi:phosphotransferase [Marinigracilibium pacificum]|uniref:Phosphotransferase n=1 Tax=Marinigracilibium pacificum TaxID=2729599 RepID=A0A848IW03_9BACT|nr:phosphotransferase [Marinigracilibium pacificum]NMM48517.1 phosphotransferase [Marinigracilibium pacificum]
MLNNYFKEKILSATKSNSINSFEVIQELWSGYGKLLRLNISGYKDHSVIVKLIDFKKSNSHPRGWNTSISHQRKLFSYEVETTWYKQYSSKCSGECRVPKCLGVFKYEGQVLIILEDLNIAGYPGRSYNLNDTQIKSCLRWLASFHATFLNTSPDGLWQTGTYWHLETRPDEYSAMKNKALKEAAKYIDSKLSNARFQTFVHGDSKPANFCFTANGEQVAAVDFQYVGGGCGMKDIAYLLGACTDVNASQEKSYLDFYFENLYHLITDPSIFDELKNEWLSLYPYAIADFQRFLNGWSPDHWKVNNHALETTKKVIAVITKENGLDK